jgi:3-methyladenine DNA glycosylase AlkD
MTVKDVLQQLQALGNEKVMVINAKKGVGKQQQYGVKHGDIRNVAKKIKTNHALGLELWKTKNLEAKLLACLILKPTALSKKELDAMVKSIDFVHVADWFNSYVLKDHPLKDEVRETWMNSDNRWAARSGWSLMAGKIARDAEGLDLEKLLDRIEQEMPKALPEVQWTMNFALAYIGIHHSKHRKRAMDIGNRLGIYRDYPVPKDCTSPFAPIWINEMVSRQEKGEKVSGKKEKRKK